MSLNSNNMSPKVGVCSVVLKDGKMLLGKRKGSHGARSWAAPGGHLEYGESALECAKRELAEETGLTLKHAVLGPYTNDLIKPENKHYVTLVVFITDFSGELKCMEPDKCEGWQWFPLENLPKPLFCPVNTLIKQVGPEALRTFSL